MVSVAVAVNAASQPNPIIILLRLISVRLSQTKHCQRVNNRSDSNRILMRDKERKGGLCWKRDALEVNVS